MPASWVTFADAARFGEAVINATAGTASLEALAQAGADNLSGKLLFDEVTELLGSFGWPAERVMDLGGIEAARAQEMYLPLWLRLFGAAGTPMVNVELRSAQP